MEQEKRIVPVHATPELLSEMESLVIRGGGTAATTDDTNTYCGEAKCDKCGYCPIVYEKTGTLCGIAKPNSINICKP